MSSKVSTYFKNLDFTQYLDGATIERIQTEVIDDMIKTSIEVGNSPVKGFGRYVGYAGERNRKKAASDIKKKRDELIARADFAGAKKLGSLARKSAQRQLTQASQTEEGYPFSVRKEYPGKALRPVNLDLSGEMLSYYEVEKCTDTSVNIGILDSSPEDVRKRAEGNNLGTAKGVPARRFVPIGGETFKIDIMTKIRDILADRLVRYFKESD